MDYLQTILAYAALSLALVYLVRKFLLPRRKKKGRRPGCSEDDCNCH